MSGALKKKTVSAALALEGGAPVRSRLLSYGRQTISSADIDAVVAALKSDWLTTGPRVAEFENAVAGISGSRHAVAVNSGTAALHAAIDAIGIQPGDEVIVPPLTFAATANAVLYRGGTPVFADVSAGSLLLDPAQAARKISPRTRAIIAVDYAGQPCDFRALRALTEKKKIILVADACHSIGARRDGVPVGKLADITAYSFHPVKHITTGEGGMAVTDNEAFAQRMRQFRNHGISTDLHEREKRGTWFYEMRELGFNYRLSDIQCALGLSQLSSLSGSLARRRNIARRYDEAFLKLPFQPLEVESGVEHAYHLYVVRLDAQRLSADRGTVFQALRAEGIGVSVHYPPVHLHPYYQRTQGTHEGMCPIAETAYDGLLSLPIFPGMTDRDVDDVIAAVGKVTNAFRK